jgi:arginine/ornithine transport system permease protein
VGAGVNLGVVAAYMPAFVEGVGVTLRLVAVSFVIGLAPSVPLALARICRVPVASQLARGYSCVVRGTPLPVQVYLLNFGLAQFEAVRASWAWYALEDPLTCLNVGFALNTSARIVEIRRGAFRAVPRCEIEAARAFGMTEAKVVLHVTLPDAVRRSIPPLPNEPVFLTHASVIASVPSVADILGVGRDLNASCYVVREGFPTAAAFHAAIIGALTAASRAPERRYARFLR